MPSYPRRDLAVARVPNDDTTNLTSVVGVLVLVLIGGAAGFLAWRSSGPTAIVAAPAAGAGLQVHPTARVPVPVAVPVRLTAPDAVPGPAGSAGAPGTTK